MFHLIIWLLTLGLLAIWSLGAWAFHSMAAWAVTNAGVLAGGSVAGVLRLPDWLAPWVPPELADLLTSLLSAFAPAVEGLIGWMPALAGGLSVVVWGVWALGSVLLLVLGLALSGATSLVRRRSARQTRASLQARPAG